MAKVIKCISLTDDEVEVVERATNILKVLHEELDDDNVSFYTNGDIVITLLEAARGFEY